MRRTPTLPGILPSALLAALLLAPLTGCAAPPNDAAAAPARAAVALESRALAPAAPCLGAFVRHELNHVTRARGPEVGYYDSNGAGVAAGDLDGDGDLDLAFANLQGRNTVAWNDGGWRFREQSLRHGGSRAAAIVDVEGDGRLDLVFSQSTGTLSRWRNLGGAASGGDVADFRLAGLPGVTTPAYAMAWADLDGDGDLDLATASYDTLLAKELRDGFLFSGGAGVMLYQQTSEGFRGTRLDDAAQALALTLFDVDGDGRDDLLVGNDFALPDRVFVNPGPSSGSASWGAWPTAEPFRVTSRNTMGFEVADVDNDGHDELFATDMKPDFGDPAALAAWLPLLERGYRTARRGERQIAENVLLARRGDGFENRAYRLGIDATGWSWSGRFGDLDLDGRLDLYVVNGMIATEAFGHLPGAELVEPNRAFRGTPGGFDPAPDWGLGAADSGRGMVLADLDDDGDLDVAINNLNTPAVLFENRLCRAGRALALELRQPGANPYALGATVRLPLGNAVLSRRVDATGGYLSGAPERLHLGIPASAAVGPLEIVWPDGATSVLAAPPHGALLRIERLDLSGEALR